MERRFRPFAIVAPEFTAVEVAAADPGLTRADDGPAAPFAAVELQVHRPAEDSGLALAGLASEAGDHVLAGYDAAHERFVIEVRVGGRRRLLRRRTLRLEGDFRMAFVLCENRVTVLVADVGTGDGIDAWRPVLSERDKVAELLDLRRSDTIAAMGYAWGTRGEVTPQVSNVRAGLFGRAGLRDLHLVQHADGRPVVVDGRLYLTATCAGPGFFQQAHWGVFSLDPECPDDLRQEAQLFFEREGVVLGDHAGQVVRDADEGGWIVATSAWGDFRPGSVHVRHTTTTADVLHGVHVLETERTSLPTDLACWDPGLTLIDDQWHVSYVESPSQQPFEFRPRLAVAPPGSAWADDLAPVGDRPPLTQCEGPVIARVQGEWWFLASDGDERCYPAYTTAMKRVGRLDAPYGSNIPHPQVVPLDDGSHLLVTFDGTQFGEEVLGYGGHGDVVVMRS